MRNLHKLVPPTIVDPTTTIRPHISLLLQVIREWLSEITPPLDVTLVRLWHWMAAISIDLVMEAIRELN